MICFEMLSPTPVPVALVVNAAFTRYASPDAGVQTLGVLVAWLACNLAGADGHADHRHRRDADAERVVALLQGLSCKVNLIPFNPFPESGLTRSPRPQVMAFANGLVSDMSLPAMPPDEPARLVSEMPGWAATVRSRR